MTAQSSIVLHIERLILEGLPIQRGQAALLQSAVEAELSLLLSERRNELLATGAVPLVSGGQIQLSSNGQPALLGRQIARAICSGMIGPIQAGRHPASKGGSPA